MDAPVPEVLLKHDVWSPDEVLRRAMEMLAPIADRSGGVLYSGRSTLVRGNLYVMGLNPGGRTEGAGAENGTIGESLRNTPEVWSSYADEAYGQGGKPSLLQTRIRTVFEALGADPRQTFATNAVFTRSRNAAELADANDGAWDLWWKHCWPVHQLFLHVVRPRVIVCLGNGPGSAFEMLRFTGPSNGRSPTSVWPPSQDETSASGRLREDVALDLGDYGRHPCMVLGLPHPSPLASQYWPLTPDALAKIEKARHRIVGWERPDAAT